MARLNTRLSHAYSHDSRHHSETPASDHSEQENDDPTVSMTPQQSRSKGKERAATDMPPSSQRRSRTSLPTPNSDPSDASRGQKRKRNEVPAPTQMTEEEEEKVRFTKYYDPDQKPQERQENMKELRKLDRDFEENRDGYLHDDGEGLTLQLHQRNSLFKKVKQTTDAIHDSRGVMEVSNLASKKAAQMVLGDGSTGVDVDEFVSKCITFMRHGGPPNADNDPAPSDSRRRRATQADDDDELDDDADGLLDWEVLGRLACFPHNSRPPVPSFLLGPLSVEKKVRTQTQRRARQAKDTAGREVRPEAISRDDLQQNDEASLTAQCKHLRKHLEDFTFSAQERLELAGFTQPEHLDTEEGRKMLKKQRLSKNGYVFLQDFFTNPWDFGQSVYNLFLVTFLIKEGVVGVEYDDDGFPTLGKSCAWHLFIAPSDGLLRSTLILEDVC